MRNFKMELEESSRKLLGLSKNTLFNGMSIPEFSNSVSCFDILASLIINWVERDVKPFNYVGINDKAVCNRALIVISRLKSYWQNENRLIIFKKLVGKCERTELENEVLLDYVNGFFYGNVGVDSTINTKVVEEEVYIKVYDYNDSKYRVRYGKYIPKLVSIISNIFSWRLYITSRTYVCVDYKYTQKNKINVDVQGIVDTVMYEASKYKMDFVPIENDAFYYLSARMDSGFSYYEHLLEEIGIRKEFNDLSHIKKFARSKKIFSGYYEKVELPILFRFLDKHLYECLSLEKKAFVNGLVKLGGLIYIDAGIADTLGIDNGCKMMVTGKSLFFRIKGLYKSIGAHCIFSDEENKLSIDICKMRSMMYISKVHPSEISNLSKDAEHDNMSVWASGNLGLFVDIDKDKITDMINMFMNHKVNDKFINDVVNYKNNKNEVVESSLGKRLQLDVWDAYTKADFDELIMRSLRMASTDIKFNKLVAFGMPDDLIKYDDGQLEEVSGLVIRYPNAVPFYMTVKVNKMNGIVYLPYDFIYNVSGGDCDGDLFIIYLCTLKKAKKLAFNKVFEWTNDNDVRLYKSYIKLPNKTSSNDMTIQQAFKNMLDSMKNIGLAFRLSMCIREIIEIVYGRSYAVLASVYLNSNLVQRAIDALKHSDNFVLPNFRDALNEALDDLCLVDKRFYFNEFVKLINARKDIDKGFRDLLLEYNDIDDSFSNYIKYRFTLAGYFVKMATKEYSLNQFVNTTFVGCGLNDIYGESKNITVKVPFQGLTFLECLVGRMRDSGVVDYSKKAVDDNHKALGYANIQYYVWCEPIEGFVQSYFDVDMKNIPNAVKRVAFNYKLFQSSIVISIDKKVWDFAEILNKTVKCVSPCDEFVAMVNRETKKECGIYNADGDIVYSPNFRHCYSFVKLTVK